MKTYKPQEIEPKWQQFWEKEGLNKAIDFDKKKKFYCLDMFPYPSGDGLHVGHPEGYTATDIYSRYLRMNGYNILHPIGWDAFGLPAENYAIKNKIHPQKSTEKNIAHFKKQIQSLGFSYDWNREVNTSDPSYYKWTQWLFLELYKKGLAYQKTAPVNWCDSCQTVLAREQVIDGKCERCKNTVVQKELKQWFFKITDYAEELLTGLKKLDWPENIKLMQENWIGRSEGALIDFKAQDTSYKIQIFTTRPDTIFGATYLVLAPEHKLISKIKSKISNISEVENYIQKTHKKTELQRSALEKEKTGVELKGIKAINPANKKEIPIYIADYVLTTYGTGAIMAVPAHDQRDFEFAKKYNLPIKEVIIPKVIDKHDPPKDKVKTIFRKSVQVILINPKNGKVLALKWKKFPWTTFITGGIRQNENIIEAAKRETLEETGYSNVKYVKTLGGPVESHFFASHKGENRKAHFSALIFELINDKQTKISDQEKAIHDCVWLTWDELNKDNNIKCAEYEIWLKRLKCCDYAFTDKGILTNSGQFDGMDSEKASGAIIKLIGGKKTVQYKLHDWLISRQRYWGAPIPIIYCDKCGIVPVPEKDLPVELPNDVDFRPTGESPLVRSKKFHNVKCPKCDSPARRESDTMDTFVDSSWYFLRYTDPKSQSQIANNKKRDYWLPVDLYVGGAEHAVMHLLYARFMTKVLRDLGYIKFAEPFLKLRNQGLILAPDGRKMSKSLGNVINPDDIVKQYGADTLRLYEMFMGPLEDAKPWDTKGIVGIKRFLDKVWKYSSTNNQAINENNIVDINLVVKKVTDDIKSLHFNTAISSMMIYINNALTGNITINKEEKKIFTIILAPFAPHLAEEIWQNVLGNKKSIFLEQWPEYKELKKSINIIVVQINGKVRAKIEAEFGIKQEQIEKIALDDPLVKKWINGKKIKKTIYISGKIFSIVV